VTAPARYDSIFRAGQFAAPLEMQARIRSLPRLAPLQRVGTESKVSAAICSMTLKICPSTPSVLKK